MSFLLHLFACKMKNSIHIYLFIFYSSHFHPSKKTACISTSGSKVSNLFNCYLKMLFRVLSRMLSRASSQLLPMSACLFLCLSHKIWQAISHKIWQAASFCDALHRPPPVRETCDRHASSRLRSENRRQCASSSST